MPDSPAVSDFPTPDGTVPRDYFEALYAADPDPWRFATSPYEAGKYAATVAALPRAQYASGFEVGCAGGIFTRQLAPRCGCLLAVDTSEVVLAQARTRCADLPHVTLEARTLPAEWPEAVFDLVVLSEVGYYLGDADFAALLRCLDAGVAPGGHLVLVHWTHPTDYPRTGDAVHDAITARPAWRVLASERTPDYRLDVLERRP